MSSPAAATARADPPTARLSPWRCLALLAAAVVAPFAYPGETAAVYFLMLAPFADVWTRGVALDRRRRLSADGLRLAIGAVAAYLMHSAMADMLGGSIRMIELAFTVWVFAGGIFLLDLLDRGVRRLLGERAAKPAGSLLRMLIVLAVTLPAAAATLQCVRVKLGYELPAAARAMKPVTFDTPSTGRVSIRGYYFDRGADTTIVLAHGVGAHSENFIDQLLPQLRDGKVNGLIFDFRAHGYSGGHVATFGALEADDLRAAVRWLKAHHPDAGANLIFYGFSMGSAAAVRAAVDEPNLRGLIIDSGFAKLTDVARAVSLNTPPVLRGYLYHAALPIACAITQSDLYAIEPAEDIKRITAPIKVVHGGADALIPVEQGRRLAESAGTSPTIVPGAGHVGLSAADPSYHDEIARFIELVGADVRNAEGEARVGRITPSIGAPPAE